MGHEKYGQEADIPRISSQGKALEKELNNLGEAEKKGRESEEKDRTWTEERLWVLSSIVEQSTEGMALSDLEGHLLFVNSAFAGMHGYTAEELVGKHLSILHTAEQMPSVEAANRQLQEAGEFSGEIWHVRRDGTLFPTLMRNSLLRNEKGNPIGMIGTLRDITDLKQVEAVLTSTITKLEEAQKDLELLQEKNLENEKLGLFYKVVSFIAHDLKSSTSVLSLVVRNCMEKIKGQAFLERAFETITRETEKMRQLMITFSNLPPTLGLKFQKCNIIDLIANTLIRFEPFANVEIIQNLSHLPPVYGDGKALETVFFNVIKNSLEAMPRGGRLVIATDHIRAKNSVRISIADTGLGISEVYLNDGLFKPFSTTKDRGLGLGLYQSRDIVERHGGEIILKSQLNQGTECIIALPISR